eukprot:1504637-Rhodomonas_salina.1
MLLQASGAAQVELHDASAASTSSASSNAMVVGAAAGAAAGEAPVPALPLRSNACCLWPSRPGACSRATPKPQHSPSLPSGRRASWTSMKGPWTRWAAPRPNMRGRDLTRPRSDVSHAAAR